MKGISIVAFAVMACAGCSNQVRPELAYSVPETHVFQKALLNPSAGAGRVEITRDYLPGHNFPLRVWVNAKAVADIGNREKLSFYLPPGRHEIALGGLNEAPKGNVIDVPGNEAVSLRAREVAWGWGGFSLEKP